MHIFGLLSLPSCSLQGPHWGDTQMANRNVSVVTEFILLGLTDNPELNTVLFVLFLSIYFVTVVGNVWIIAIIWASTQLHSPKYFFLCQLAFLDFCYSSVFIPKMLVNYLAGQKVISYHGCLLQYSFVSMILTTECFLLAAMAYDRYVAICRPLHYKGLMTPTFCTHLVAACYLLGSASSLTHLRGLLSLSFCGPNIINHYFCDIPLLFQLSCSDTQHNKILLTVLSGMTSVTTFLMVVGSYVGILLTVLKSPSTRSRYKAFSTCVSHLTVVTLFYGTVIFTYLGSSSSSAPDRAKILSMFYTLLLPILNFLIYSVRNTEANEAMKRIIVRKIFAL
ncbi:olfactory receptor 1052-like [Felis catus]|uniref:olfactory receptor 1052-like n=1 Tax=Felis catus TaxID=9685 RepID=UPI001D1994FC|nr:olfactory receptor 1052-like [Felis catus]